MAMNVFNSAGTAFLGPQPFAFDRARMLAGQPATFITTGITGGSNEETYLPADLDAAGFSLRTSGVPQLGTSSVLDPIGDRLMFRAATRFFPDGHESVVGNYTVQSGGVAAVRWFELRNTTAGPVTVFQESTYQPDTTHRWMGSAAMDQQGNLAVGYSASSTAIKPQVRYAGRLVSDPLNTLPQAEVHLFDGTGSQTGTSGRWAITVI